MEQCNGLFSSESLDGLQQKWINGVGDSVTSSAYLPNKRKRDDVGQESNGVHNGDPVLRNSLFPEFSRRNRPFIHISGQKGVYFSERWEPNGSTLYLPVNGSLLTNIDKYDQISFEQGLFFIGDISGAFQQKAQGQAIHCWRYNDQERKLFIALSYFFTNLQHDYAPLYKATGELYYPTEKAKGLSGCGHFSGLSMKAKGGTSGSSA